MKFRIAASLLALSLPLAAQKADETANTQVESVFYKAYYLEKGQRDFAGAMVLYDQFLAKAPEHKLAAEAAVLQYRLLDRTGKTAERDAFKAKYEKLLGNLANAPARPAGGDEAGDAPGRGQRGQRGPGGQRGQGGRGLMGLMRGDTKVADMNEEQLKELKTGVDQAGTMVDRIREMGNEEMAAKLETAVASLKKALDAGKMDDAQKAMDDLRGAMPARGRGRGGNAGGGGRGRGGAGGGAGGGGNGGGSNGGGGGGGGGNR